MKTDGPINAILPRGRLLFREKGSDTYEYLAESPEITLTADTTTVELQGSDAAVGYTIASTETARNYTGSFQLVHISDFARALWSKGVVSNYTQTSNSESDEEHTVRPGQTVRLGVSAQNLRGVRAVTGVVVTDDDSGSPQTFIEGVDYDLDARRGTVYIREDGGIGEDVVILVSYDYPTASSPQVTANASTMVREGELWLQATNAVGPDVDYIIPRAQIRPSGDFSLKGDDFQRLNFEITILPDDSGAFWYTEGAPQES